MELNLIKLPIRKGNVALKIAPGHFATNHSHINYYIDVTTTKTRLSEAQAVAKELVKKYMSTTIVDTILCLEGTEVIGTCLAQALTEAGFLSINAHQTIYVIKPEYNTNSQLIFRENIQPMVRGKHVLVLAASVTTGYTVQGAVEAIRYYGGEHRQDHGPQRGVRAVLRRHGGGHLGHLQRYGKKPRGYSGEQPVFPERPAGLRQLFGP